MQIAVTAKGPSLDDQVEVRFGRASYYIFIDTESMNFDAIKNPNVLAGGGAGIQSAQLLANRGVTHVLTGNCGPNAFSVFGAAGIQVIPAVSGTVRNAIEQFKAGSVTPADRANVESHFGMSLGNVGDVGTADDPGTGTDGGNSGGMSGGRGMGMSGGMGGGRGMGMGGGMGSGRGMGMGGGMGSGRGMGMGGGMGSGRGMGMGGGMGSGRGMGMGGGMGSGRGMGMGGGMGSGRGMGMGGGGNFAQGTTINRDTGGNDRSSGFKKRSEYPQSLNVEDEKAQLLQKKSELERQLRELNAQIGTKRKKRNSRNCSCRCRGVYGMWNMRGCVSHRRHCSK